MGAFTRSDLKMNLYGFLLASSGFFFSMGYGMFNTYMDVFAKKWGLEKSDEDKVSRLLNISFVLGCFFCSVTSSLIYDYIGRFKSLVLVFLIEIGFTFLGLFHSINLIYAMRFFHGYAGWFWILLTPTIIKENLPEKFNIRYNPVFSVFFCSGYIITYSLGSEWGEKIWRLVLVWPFFTEPLKLALFLIFFRMESPAWMISRGYKFEAVAANFETLHSKDSAKQLATSEFAAYTAPEKSSGILEIFSPTYRKQLIMTVLLNAASALDLSGLLNLYSTGMYKSIGLDNAKRLTIITAYVNLMSSFVLMGLLRLFGKWRTFIIGLIGLSIAYLMFLSGLVSRTLSLIIIAPNLYMASYSLSLGGLLFPYFVDIVPPIALSFCSSLQWILVIFVAYYGKTIANGAELFWATCFVYALCIVSTIAFLSLSIDTAGKTSEQIRKEFNEKKLFFQKKK